MSKLAPRASYVLGGIVGLVLAHFAFVDGFCVVAPGGFM